MGDVGRPGARPALLANTRPAQTARALVRRCPQRASGFRRRAARRCARAPLVPRTGAAQRRARGAFSRPPRDCLRVRHRRMAALPVAQLLAAQGSRVRRFPKGKISRRAARGGSKGDSVMPAANARCERARAHDLPGGCTRYSFWRSSGWRMFCMVHPWRPLCQLRFADVSMSLR